MKKILPRGKCGIEIGVGTGRFASQLGIKFGIDNSINMLKISKERDVKVIQGIAEKLPIKSSIFDFVVMITTLCFLKSVNSAFREIFRILKEGGIAVMVIQDQTKNFGKTLTSFRTIVDWCDNIGFKLFECLIYKKYGAEGAWWNKRFRVDHEYMPVFLKGEKLQYFNKEPLKIPSKWGGKTLKGGATRLTNGKTIKARPIKINPLKCRGTIWEYLTAGDGSKLKHQHPATFPDKLPYDFIQCFCPEKGVVLDPFIGSGTTAIAAVKLNRNFIGFDVSEEYCDLARKRLELEANFKQERLL